MGTRDSRVDMELLRRWSNGDDAAGSELFSRHAEALIHFLRRRFGDDADDLAQEAFLACFQNAGRFRGESAFRSYLLSIARYQGLAHRRRLMRAIKLETALVDQEDTSGLGDPHPEETLVVAIGALPEQLREVLHLVYWLGLPQPEIARILEIPVGTVASRLRSAKERLRDLVAYQIAPRQAGTGGFRP